MAIVVVERVFLEPVDLAWLRAAVADNKGCLDLHRVRYIKGYLSGDLLHMVCLFEAPDAESVRIVNRQVGMPYERVWTATIHEPLA